MLQDFILQTVCLFLTGLSTRSPEALCASHQSREVACNTLLAVKTVPKTDSTWSSLEQSHPYPMLVFGLGPLEETLGLVQFLVFRATLHFKRLTYSHLMSGPSTLVH